jgi:hypothetical protein
MNSPERGSSACQAEFDFYFGEKISWQLIYFHEGGELEH